MRLFYVSQCLDYFIFSKKEKTSPSADMVRLYVNVQFKVKPLSTGTSSSRTKKKAPKKLEWTPPKFGVSSTSLS